MMRFLLDMDGVIADLDAGLRNEFGIIAPSRDSLFKEYLPEYVNRGGFATSPVMPHATELLAMLVSYGEVAICTSIGQFADGDEVIQQKKFWLDKNFPELSKAPFIATSSGAQKAFFAGTGILVDDWLANVQAFRTAGGRALHYTGQDVRDEVQMLWWNR